MKKIVTTTILCCICFPILFSQCLSGNCKDGTGVKKMKDGSIFIGQFKKGKPNGVGRINYVNGDAFQGEWLAGKPHGAGTLYKSSGLTQIGNWDNGSFLPLEEQGQFSDKGSLNEMSPKIGCINGDCLRGEGVYVFKSGAIYSGSFLNGEIHGSGVCIYPDGSKYEGEWKNRFYHGNGTLTYANGKTRSGLWEKGYAIKDINGKQLGIERSFQVAVQSGCLSGNCIDGEGIKAYTDGSRYEGRFRKGKPSGFGTFYFPNGAQYSGGFKDGVEHGRGRYIHTDGTVIAGDWTYGEKLQNGTNRVTTLGCIAGNCTNGYGTYLFKDGSVYTGTFKNGIPDGHGKVEYPEGQPYKKYEGQMTAGKFNGIGTLVMTNGSSFAGKWQNGMYVGRNNPQSNNEGLPKIWAVIIGIAAYNHMPVLKYTDDDAYRFYAFLKSPEGGAIADERVRILIDEVATKRNIMAVMKEIFSKASDNDVVMLYFSGHGLMGSFLPIDYDGFNNQLYHTEIKEILEKSRAKLKLCIADACHSGSLLADRSGEIDESMEAFFQKLDNVRGGTALIMSSKSNETSLESSGLRQGVFSHFLIKGLKGDADSDYDQFVTVPELYQYISTNVRSYTNNRQTPLLKGDFDKDTPLSKKY
ncbi:MAG: caspase family protein [Bacteroidota bacterium]